MVAPVAQPESLVSFFRAEPARISLTSRQVRSALALRTSAATPETMAADAEVPANAVPIAVVVMGCQIALPVQRSPDGAHSHRVGPLFRVLRSLTLVVHRADRRDRIEVCDPAEVGIVTLLRAPVPAEYT